MFEKKMKHNWKPYGEPIVSGGKIFVVEYCDKTGMYRYIRVPSFAKAEEIESGMDQGAVK